MLNSSGNVFTGTRGTRQTPSCEITHMDFGMVAHKRTHTEQTEKMQGGL